MTMGVGSSSLVPEAGEAIVGFGVDLANYAENSVDLRDRLNEWPALLIKSRGGSPCEASIHSWLEERREMQ